VSALGSDQGRQTVGNPCLHDDRAYLNQLKVGRLVAVRRRFRITRQGGRPCRSGCKQHSHAYTSDQTGLLHAKTPFNLELLIRAAGSLFLQQQDEASMTGIFDRFTGFSGALSNATQRIKSCLPSANMFIVFCYVVFFACNSPLGI
jgi:hypothetical protein